LLNSDDVAPPLDPKAADDGDAPRAFALLPRRSTESSCPRPAAVDELRCWHPPPYPPLLLQVEVEDRAGKSSLLQCCDDGSEPAVR
jgi:hypothetical protein